MKIPKYWAKSTQRAEAPYGGNVAVSCWNWSDVSQADAKRNADAKGRDLLQRVFEGERLNRYSYGQGALREEMIQGVSGPGGREVGVVTRNLYGARILNTANVMFIDIDFNEGEGSASTDGPVGRQVQRVLDWARRNPGLGMRIYRTYAGLRCLVTSELFQPASAGSLEILRGLGSDPLYIKLCQVQDCFRARLTPKPWRCSMGKPPGRFPWSDREAENRYRTWERRYEQTIGPYAVCAFIQEAGRPDVHPDAEAVIRLHDELTAARSGRPLA